MTPTIQWAIGLLVAAVMFAIGELIVTSRDTDKRIGELERKVDRQQEQVIAGEKRLDIHRDMLLEKVVK